MTKKEALAEFRELILPKVEAKYSKKDKVAKAEAWNDYVDFLQKNGEITESQAFRWDNPF